MIPPISRVSVPVSYVPQVSEDFNLPIPTPEEVLVTLQNRAQNVVETAQEYTTTTGSSLYGGIVVDSFGRVILSPYGAQNIGLFSSSNIFTTYSSGLTLPGDIDYAGGCYTPNGLVVFTPFNQDKILVYDTLKNLAYNVPFSVSSPTSERFSGCAYSPVDQTVYFIPYDATVVLRFNPFTFETSTTNFGLNLTGGNKWDGAVLGLNNKIYAVPRDQNNILVIDPYTQSASLVAASPVLSGTNKYNGGCLAQDGKIYCPPRSATNLLVIDTVANTITTTNFGFTNFDANAGSATDKYRGMYCGLNGKLYGIPSSANKVLVVDPINQTIEMKNYGLTITGFRGSAMRNGQIILGQFSSNKLVAINTGTPTQADLRLQLSPYFNRY